MCQHFPSQHLKDTDKVVEPKQSSHNLFIILHDDVNPRANAFIHQLWKTPYMAWQTKWQLKQCETEDVMFAVCAYCKQCVKPTHNTMCLTFRNRVNNKAMISAATVVPVVQRVQELQMYYLIFNTNTNCINKEFTDNYGQ